MIENAPVITNILDLEVVKLAGAEIGDIVLEIDGENALTRIGERAKYRSASTPHRLMHRAAFVSLAGVEDSVAVLTLMNRNKEVKKVLLTRNAAFGDLSLGERSGDVCKFLAQDIGYADLDRLTIPEAIIFDMRGYPKATAWEIAPRLSEKKAVGAAWFDCPLVLAPDGQVGDITDLPSYHSFVQHIPATDKRQYAGKTVMLIDERCQSQAEHTGLFFEAANGTKFIGTHSAGANGDVTNFYLPGGITIWFTGMSVRHADGRQLQRIGLVPDIEVRPTINGIQNGKDEILESAIAYLLDELG
jgi:C-terminal processing protease CtpA/Prc